MSDTKEKKLDFGEIIRIGGVLCIICAAVALVLSFVNTVTAKKIAENEESEKRSAIIALFGSESVTYTSLEAIPEKVDEVYLVSDGGTDLGYCVGVSPAGFGGGVNIMVALDESCAVIGVRIVAHSETPGLGSRVEADSFLSQFIGKAQRPLKGQDYDIISGSTISSEAIADGVGDAIEALDQILKGGASN